MATTLLKRLDYVSGDNSLPLFCEDPAGQAKGTTDFVFDWRAPIEWGGNLPPAGQGQPTGPFANLALDKSTVLGRDQSVRVANAGGGTGHTGDGRGLAANNGGNAGYQLTKSAVANSAVCDPKSEGFRDFYMGAWIVLIGARANQFEAGFLGLGQGADVRYGLWIEDDNTIGLRGTDRRLRPAVVGALMHLGFHLAFDTAADTTTVRVFADGAEIGAAAAALAKPSAWPDPVGQFQVGSMGGYGSAKHALARLTRTFTRWPGQGALDPLQIHKEEERYNRGRLS